MSLDLRAARRQTLAVGFRAQDVALLKAGRLRMSPHPEWRLPQDPTWQEDPFADRNWCFQFHMLRWLDPLRRAAAQGDDAAYALWLRWIQDWAAKNPHDAPASPWAWTDMSDGIRAQQLCLAAPMVAERSPELLDRLEDLIRVHAEHLADPVHMGRANHALHQQESLFVCGRVLGEERLWELALERMGALLREQYDEQGMNAEGATAYHVNNVLWWEKALSRIDREGLPRPEGAERHLSAPEGIAHATRPDGTLVAIGDTDTVSPTTVDAPATRHATTDGADGTAPTETTRVFDAGYVFARSGWGDAERPFSAQTFFSLRFGPAQRVHGHPDGGSLTYSADGVNWLVDLGKFQYGSGLERNHVASRAAHSLVSIAGRTPRKDAVVELIAHRATATHEEFVLRDDSFTGVELTRRVIWSRAGEHLVVIDDVRADEEVRALQRWQLGPDVEVEGDPGERAGSLRPVRLSSGGRRALLALGGDVQEVEQVRGRQDSFDGWVSVAWKKVVPATAVTASARGTSLRFVAVIAAGHGAEPEARVLEEHGPESLVPDAPAEPPRPQVSRWRRLLNALLTPAGAETIEEVEPQPRELRLDITSGRATERVSITEDEVTALRT
ncbi:heparinase II/III domain-containing protein [Brachybacterium sp. DNPG3]